MVAGFLCISRRKVFPCFFPLLGRDIPDELFHAVCAGLSHLLCHMPVNVQRKGRRCVPKVSLNRLDVISSAQGRHSITVPQIVKAGIRQANRACHALETMIHRMRREVVSDLIGKYKVPLFPSRSHCKAFQLLTDPVVLQQFRNRRRERNSASFSVFSSDQAIRSLPYMISSVPTSTRPSRSWWRNASVSCWGACRCCCCCCWRPPSWFCCCQDCWSCRG